jgi:hypothetical protein
MLFWIARHRVLETFAQETRLIGILQFLDARVAQFGYAYPLDAAYTQFYSEFFPAATRGITGGLSFGF